ncbi:mutator family transposase [Prauserella muralis]|nr:mutator family transposase [Prauserella muralis]
MVGWLIAEGESAALAEKLLADTIAKQGIDPDTLTVHADNGSSMASKPVAFLLADLGVTKTHSRPHTSNDNLNRPGKSGDSVLWEGWSHVREYVEGDCNFVGVTPEVKETPVTDGTGNGGEAKAPAMADGVDDQLVQQLADRARAEGLQLTGEGGLLAMLTKKVVESALEGEMDDHLGYSKHDPAGRNGGNSRNGRRGKKVLTEAGPVEIATPRDRDGSFEPQLVGKGQRRLTGLDDLVISLSAKVI